MIERLKTQVSPAEQQVDRAEVHDPVLAAEFGRVMLEAMGPEVFLVPTMKETTVAQEPFGVNLVEERAGFETTGRTDETIVAIGDETTFVLKMSTDWT